MSIHLKSLFMPHQCHARGGWNRPFAGQWQWPYGLTVIQSADSRAGLAERKGNDGSRLHSCSSVVWFTLDRSVPCQSMRCERSVSDVSLAVPATSHEMASHLQPIGICFGNTLLFVYFRDARLPLWTMLSSCLIQAQFVHGSSSLMLEHNCWHLHFGGLEASWFIETPLFRSWCAGCV